MPKYIIYNKNTLIEKRKITCSQEQAQFQTADDEIIKPENPVVDSKISLVKIPEDEQIIQITKGQWQELLKRIEQLEKNV